MQDGRQVITWVGEQLKKNGKLNLVESEPSTQTGESVFPPRFFGEVDNEVGSGGDAVVGPLPEEID